MLGHHLLISIVNGFTVDETGEGGQSPAGQAQTPAPASGGSTAELAAAARSHLRNAEAAAGRGDWSTYGSEMAALQQALDQLAGSAGP